MVYEDVLKGDDELFRLSDLLVLLFSKWRISTKSVDLTAWLPARHCFVWILGVDFYCIFDYRRVHIDVIFVIRNIIIFMVTF